MTIAGLARDEAISIAPGRRLNVAQVVTKFTAGAGGITLRGALTLDPERYTSTILAADGGSLIEDAEDAGLEVIRLCHMRPELNAVEDFKGISELAAHLAARRFDIVHTHSAKAGGLGRIAARRVGVPAIVHSLHGFPFHEFQSRIGREGYLVLERRLGAITDYFLTDGTFVASEAVRLKIAPPERIRAIASPVDTVPAVTAARRTRAREALGISDDVRLVGTAARLDRQKAPLDMVAAIAALGRTDVHMAWIGDGQLRSLTERAIARAGLQQRFRLLGNRDDVLELLPGFDVFAMSSLYEGLPCAVVEAMTCGIPVVATAVNSVPEVVVPGRTGVLARPGDSASLSRALAYVLDHPGDAARMARAAREHLGDRFSAETLGRDLGEAYALAMRFAAHRGR